MVQGIDDEERDYCKLCQVAEGGDVRFDLTRHPEKEGDYKGTVHKRDVEKGGNTHNIIFLFLRKRSTILTSDSSKLIRQI